jgi:hypothetical protein
VLLVVYSCGKLFLRIGDQFSKRSDFATNCLQVGSRTQKNVSYIIRKLGYSFRFLLHNCFYNQ